jgi:hypothetical protein
MRKTEMLKLTKNQIHNIIEEITEKVKFYKAKTSKDVEIILLEMFNEEFDHIYNIIQNTWSDPYKAITNRICKKLSLKKSDEFTMQ